MARMMDIGKKNPSVTSQPTKDATESRVPFVTTAQAPETSVEDTKPTITPEAPKPIVQLEAAPKRSEIPTFALPPENPGQAEAKTFPLAPVLAVIGILVVLAIVYLLVFVQSS